jgi:hypothetical protein
MFKEVLDIIKQPAILENYFLCVNDLISQYKKWASAIIFIHG